MSNDDDSKCSSSSSVSGKGLDCKKKEGYEESHIKNTGGKLENDHIEDEDDDDRSPMEWSDDEDSILNHLNKAAHKTTKRKRPVGPFELTFKCEWKGCSFETDEDSKFHVHVSYHIPDVEIKTLGNGDEVYMCLWADCTYLTGGAKEIQRHVTYHSYHTKLKNIGEKIVQEWKLPDCMYGKETRNLIPDKIDGMVCEWKDCNKEFNNVQLFLYHIHMHVNECFMTSDSKQEMFRCKWKGCSRGGSMPTRVRLVDHMRTHTRERVVACPTCGHVFSTNTKLSDHCHRQLPTELSEFQCSHCYKNFPSLRLLKDHMRGHVNFYKCCYCDMTCFSRHTFSAHIRYKHLDSKPFKCSLCKYACKTQYDLKTHLTSHDPDARLGCEEEGCEFSCRSKQTLQRHMIEQHQVSASSTYCCHLCDSRFKRGCYLTKHLMTKHCLRWPSGHSRFMYQRQEDGNFRLQTVRYESVKLYGENSHNTTTPSKNNFKVTPITMNGSASFKVSSIEPDSSSGVSQVFISIEDESGNTINCVTAPEVVGDEIPKYATVIASAAETSETSAETSAETAMETFTAAESCSNNNAEAVVENVGETNGGTGTETVPESSGENIEENCSE